jgi:hypothetical protein
VSIPLLLLGLEVSKAVSKSMMHERCRQALHGFADGFEGLNCPGKYPVHQGSLDRHDTQVSPCAGAGAAEEDSVEPTGQKSSKQLPSNVQEFIYGLFDKFVDPLLAFVHKGCRQAISTAGTVLKRGLAAIGARHTPRLCCRWLTFTGFARVVLACRCQPGCLSSLLLHGLFGQSTSIACCSALLHTVI